MPFTPFHLGPALLIGLLLLAYLDLPTFLAANVIVDVEPLLVLILDLDYPLHGFFHSFLGGTIAALLLTLLMTKIRGLFTPLMTLFKLSQKSTTKTILLASLTGVYLHIVLDARIYTDIQPFYPLTINPLLYTGALPELSEYLFCIWCFMVAPLVYITRLILLWKKNKIRVTKKKEW